MAPTPDAFKVSKNTMALLGAAGMVLASAVGAYHELVVPIQETRADMAIVKHDVAMIAKIVDTLQTQVITLSRENARMQSEIENLKGRK